MKKSPYVKGQIPKRVWLVIYSDGTFTAMPTRRHAVIWSRGRGYKICCFILERET